MMKALFRPLESSDALTVMGINMASELKVGSPTSRDITLGAMLSEF